MFAGFGPKSATFGQYNVLLWCTLYFSYMFALAQFSAEEDISGMGFHMPLMISFSLCIVHASSTLLGVGSTSNTVPSSASPGIH